MRFSADTNLQRIVFGGFGLKILCLTKLCAFYPSLGYLRSRLEMRFSRTDVTFDMCVHDMHSRTSCCSAYFVLSSKVKFHFSLGPLLHVCVCAHVCVCVRCGPVITSGRVACFAPALSAYISHWREHKWKSVKVLIQESSGSDRHSHDFSHGAIDVSHYILTGLDLWN